MSCLYLPCALLKCFIPPSPFLLCFPFERPSVVGERGKVFTHSIGVHSMCSCHHQTPPFPTHHQNPALSHPASPCLTLLSFFPLPIRLQMLYRFIDCKEMEESRKYMFVVPTSMWEEDMCLCHMINGLREHSLSTCALRRMAHIFSRMVCRNERKKGNIFFVLTRT